MLLGVLGVAALFSVGHVTPSSAATVSQTCPYENSTPLSAGEDRARAAMYCLINARRKEAGRGKMTVNRKLSNAANGFAAQMVSEQFFSHVDPSGVGLVERIGRSDYLSGYEVWALGENIGWGSGTLGSPKAMMDAFMASPAHRRNILSRRLRNVGVGVKTGIPVGGRFGATYVQEFGWRAR